MIATCFRSTPFAINLPAWAHCSGVNFGRLPPIRPFSRAAANPARVRSTISSLPFQSSICRGNWYSWKRCLIHRNHKSAHQADRPAWCFESWYQYINTLHCPQPFCQIHSNTRSHSTIKNDFKILFKILSLGFSWLWLSCLRNFNRLTWWENFPCLRTLYALHCLLPSNRRSGTPFCFLCFREISIKDNEKGNMGQLFRCR